MFKTRSNRFPKLLAWMLLLCIMLTAVSCAKKAPSEETAQTNPPPASVDTSYDPEIEAVDFGGESFVIFTRTNYGGSSYEEFDVQEYTDDIINQAVYDRNIYLEDKYNMEIEVNTEHKDSVAQVVYQLHLSDLVNFDMVSTTLTHMINLARNGVLAEIGDIPIIDTSAPYWFDDIIDAGTVNNKSFVLAGDANLWVLHSVGATMFNRSMINDLNLTSPYTLIENNEWTYAKLYEMTKEANLPNSNSNVASNRYGITSTYAVVETMFTGMGGTLVSRDQDGAMSVGYLSDRNIDIITKIVDYWSDTDSALLINRHDSYTSPNGASSNLMMDVFNSGNALFVIEMMYQFPTLIHNEYGVGIVPAPKYDAAQEEYYSFVHQGHATGMGVPNKWLGNSERMDRIGRVMEDMNYKSRSTVRQTYYEDNLRLRRAQDDESYEMLEIVYDRMVMDPGMMLQGAGFKASDKIRALVYAADTSDIYSSMLANYESDMEILQDLIDNYFKKE